MRLLPAEINEMVAALAAKTEKADSLLAQIAKNVEEGKTTTMDPALSDEVKRLLGCVLLSLRASLRPQPHSPLSLQRCAVGRRRARQGLSRSAHERGASRPCRLPRTGSERTLTPLVFPLAGPAHVQGGA